MSEHLPSVVRVFSPEHMVACSCRPTAGQSGTAGTPGLRTLQSTLCPSAVRTSLLGPHTVASFIPVTTVQNWTAAGQTNSHVWAFAVNGTNLFAGTDGGVYRSTDNGINWTVTSLSGTRVNALVVSDTNLFAGLDSGGVYRSTIVAQAGM